MFTRQRKRSQGFIVQGSALHVARQPAAWILLLACALVGLLAWAFARLYHFNVVDDAYISFQYAKNWAQGDGLVFNVGERVEGYSNFLWIAVLTPLYALTKALEADFTRAAIALNVSLALVDLVLLYLVGAKLFRHRSLPVTVALTLCALDNSYQGYAMSGFENHLLIGLVLGAVLVWLRPPTRSNAAGTGLLLALAAMTRPDGGILAAAFLFSALVGIVARDPADRQVPRTQIARSVLLCFGTFGLVFVTYFLWRWRYYDSLLPNTFYVKVGTTLDGMDRGFAYTQAFFANRYYIPALAALTVLWANVGIIRWLLSYVLLHSAYVTYVGGDFYSGQRYYVVLLPVLALLIGWIVFRLQERIARSKLWGRVQRYPGVAAGAIGCVAGAATFPLLQFVALGLERGPYALEILLFGEVVNKNVRYMKWLGTVAPPGASMVLGDIGAAGFLANLKVYDVYGIIDPATARKDVPNFGRGKPGHEKMANRSHLLRDHPTYVKWGWIPGDLRSDGYYIRTEFPPDLDVAALWVREDLPPGRFLPDGATGFERTETQAWTLEGTAFRSFPCTAPVFHQYPVFGHHGAYANSYAPGLQDAAMGRALSPTFPIVGDLLVLYVGGGRDRERLRVSLLVNEQPVLHATGNNQEILGRRVWRIAPFRGQTGRIEIVDQSSDAWGHIMVDEVAQYELVSRQDDDQRLNASGSAAP